MPDQQTIDRVAVGLARLSMRIDDNLSDRLLLLILDIPESEKAQDILDDNHSDLAEFQKTPQQLVQALRELAVAEQGEHEVAICGQCRGVIERDSPSDDWDHQDKLTLHKAGI